MAMRMRMRMRLRESEGDCRSEGWGYRRKSDPIRELASCQIGQKKPPNSDEPTSGFGMGKSRFRYIVGHSTAPA
jgi:hypothetical protein